MPEKAVYSLTEAGERQFEKLMQEISKKPVSIFLDFNAVIVNLDSIAEKQQKLCIENIKENIGELKSMLEKNLEQKENNTDIPATGMAVLRQQLILVQAIEDWIEDVKLS